MENKSFHWNKNIPLNSKYETNHLNITRTDPKPYKINCNEYASDKSNQCHHRKERPICYRCKETEHKADQCTFNGTKNINTTNNSSCLSDKIIKMIEIKGKKHIYFFQFTLQCDND